VIPKNIRAIIFDLDDTLIPTRKFIEPRFKQIADFLKDPSAFGELVSLWEEKTSKYPYLFDDFCKSRGLPKDMVVKMVKIMNSGETFEISLDPDVKSVLSYLKNHGFVLGLLTGGNLVRQKAKVKSLELDRWFSSVMYAKEYSSKLSSAPFKAVVDSLGVKFEETAFVGDDPVNDMKPPKLLGAFCIRLYGEEFSFDRSCDFSDLEINSFNELREIFQGV